MKIKSYALLSILALILFFIIGVRYGQNVEKTNKVINYILSITPTKSPSPTKQLEFQTYINKSCGIQFLYPAYLEKTESTISASFTQNTKTQIEINCDVNNSIKEIIDNKTTGTAEAMFKNKKIMVKTDSENVYSFKTTHPRTLKNIFISVQKTLFPLLDSSLIFN